MEQPLSILLVVDQDDEGNIHPHFSRLIGAALKLKVSASTEITIDVVVFNILPQASLDQISSFPVSKVMIMKLAEPSAEALCESIKDCLHSYTHVITVSSTFSKDWLPRLAGVLAIQPITDIISIHNAQEYSRYIYAGNLIETIKSSQPLQLISIRANLFESAVTGIPRRTYSLIETSGKISAEGSRFVERVSSKTSRPDLASATKVVSGGRGLQNKESFQLIEQLADTLCAAVGASRAAVDAGYVTNDYQVGQTGKSVAPDLYLAVGISGAVQHLAGMKDSRIIAAINSDADAPIFQVADVGLVGDLFDLLPELIEALKNSKEG